jgi:hypothetical protein
VRGVTVLPRGGRCQPWPPSQHYLVAHRKVRDLFLAAALGTRHQGASQILVRIYSMYIYVLLVTSIKRKQVHELMQS